MATGETAPAPKKKGGLTWWLLVLFLSLLAVGGGFALPLLLLGGGGKHGTPRHQEPRESALVPFGDTVVNLGTEGLARYLRVRLILVVDSTQEKTVTDLVAKQKPFLKSWLISYLADQTLQEVTGAAGVNRIRREVCDQFNAILFPNEAARIHDVLFDEFVVQ
jgi:flagellar basal body-associated protein FliL